MTINYYYDVCSDFLVSQGNWARHLDGSALHRSVIAGTEARCFDLQR